MIPAALAPFWANLGLSPAHLNGRILPFFREADSLLLAETAAHGQALYLHPAAAAGWHAMRTAAAREGLQLALISAFRSYARQTEILAAKRAEGLSFETILKVCAPPGCSEHHSGCAVDIGSPGAMDLDASFEHSPAFAWLCTHAPRFGFRLSYPRNNPEGFLYEPWHWCHGQPQSVPTSAG